MSPSLHLKSERREQHNPDGMATILVADDHPLNRHFLATLLSYHGYRILEAADGVEALEQARQHRPDLIIADVVMPRMDGFTLVQALRSDPDLAGIPIIFYTASYREAESRAIADAAGVEHLISKPSDPEVILETVHTVLQRAGRAAPQGRRRESPAQASEYMHWLQVTSIRSSAIIELSLELHAQRDPDELMRTACRVIRTIFAASHAAIAVIDRRQVWSWVDGDVDQDRLEKLVVDAQPFAMASMRNASGPSDPIVALVRPAMPDLASVVLVPMTSGRDLRGWVILGKTARSEAFSTDDEWLALAAAGQIRAAHENLILFHAQRENLSTLFDALPVSVIAFDENRSVRAWNRAAERIFGWRAAEIIGYPNPTVPPDLEQEYGTLVARCLAGATFTDIEMQRIRKDGTRVDVRLAMSPVQGPHGVPRGYVSIANDITARKRDEVDLRSSRELLRALSARLLSIQEEERTRISRELHDDLGQSLTAIKIDAARLVQDITRGAAPPISVMSGILPLIDSTLETVGRIVSELRPTRIGEMGLVAAIEKKLAEFQQRTEIECELSIRPQKLQIPDEIASTVFRILEESLTNVIRHSGATRTEVRLRRKRDELLLEIRDDGRGIREAESLAPTSYGLIGMKERAHVFAGSVTITGVEGKGTIVTARIPLPGRPAGTSE